MEQNYDIIIAGGGTAGCACAWMASKLGLKVLIIDDGPYLGGAIVKQLVTPAMKTSQNNLNTEFFDEFVKVAKSQNAQITYMDGNKGWINPMLVPAIMAEMLSDAGSTILLNSKVINASVTSCDTKHNNNKLVQNLSVCIDTKYQNISNKRNNFVAKYNDKQSVKKITKYYSKYFVDATGDGKLSEFCGAEFLPLGGTQAISLRFIAANINKKKFADWLLEFDSDRNVTTACEIGGDIHLSTAYTWDNNARWALAPLFDHAVEHGVLEDADRAYFQIFSIPGEIDKIAFNCPRILIDKPYIFYSDEELEVIRVNAEKAIIRLIDFCRLYLPGFEKCYMYLWADNFGVRESRRVKGEYVLTKDDIYNAKTFKTPVAYSDYPIDIHSVKKDSSTLHYVQKPYSVPLECLKVMDFNNLFVIGRCLSADFYAQGAVRIQPTCFSMGVGVAKEINNLIFNDYPVL